MSSGFLNDVAVAEADEANGITSTVNDQREQVQEVTTDHRHVEGTGVLERIALDPDLNPLTVGFQ
jgi:hypothetical protein